MPPSTQPFPKILAGSKASHGSATRSNRTTTSIPFVTSRQRRKLIFARALWGTCGSGALVGRSRAPSQVTLPR
jgi:hypothetical protein